MKHNMSDINNVLVSVSGTHRYDQYTEDLLEMVIPAKYTMQNGAYIITYKETEPESSDIYTTTVTVGPDRRITVVRDGDISSHMIFEQGQKHLMYYDTDFGSMTIGVSANRVNTSLDETGGDIEVDYALEIDHTVASENVFRMNIRATGHKNLC